MPSRRYCLPWRGRCCCFELKTGGRRQCMPPVLLAALLLALVAAWLAPAGAQCQEDSCFCGSPQFHIVRFSAACYDLPSQGAMGGHKK